MSRFLVTGGAGFIGSNFLSRMVENYPDDYFVCLDSLAYAGNRNNLSSVRQKPNFFFVKGDITDKSLVFPLFERERFDYVVNFAAETHVDRSIENPSLFFQTNVLGTATLLNASLAYRVRRFHQVSTDEVYGDLPLDSKEKFTEKSPLCPSSPYAASKASADLIVLAYHRTYSLPVTISRSSNNYGPNQYPEKLIPLAVEKAQKGEDIPLYGNGKNIRDWIHVLDHGRAIDRIIRNGKDGEVYNIGGHNELDNLSIVRKILSFFPHSPSKITFIEDRKGHDLRYALDTEKIRQDLHFSPEIPFDQGLKETVLSLLRKE